MFDEKVLRRIPGIKQCKATLSECYITRNYVMHVHTSPTVVRIQTHRKLRRDWHLRSTNGKTQINKKYQ
jgi:hypothetical protein